MRIGYWSSDVCFSDLRWPRLARNGAGTNQSAAKKMDSWVSPTCPKATSTSRLATTHSENNLHQGKSVGVRASATDHSRGIARSATTTRTHPDNSEGRSEEHTYELQSLLQLSYAAFCLIQKKTP